MAPASEPTQTTPEGDEREALGLPGKGGAVIPVPTRGDVFRVLRKAAKAPDADEPAESE